MENKILMLSDYTDYKAYIRDKIAAFPKNGHGVARKLAEYLNVNSVVISQVLSGEKDFTPEQALKVADFLFMKELEKDYFVLMIQRERAGTQDLKNYYQSKMNLLKKEFYSIKESHIPARELDETEKAQFYSNWYYSGIRLIVNLPEKNNVEAISNHFKIDEIQVRKVLEFLIRTGLVVDKDGQFESGSRFTLITKDSPFVNNHRRNWRLKALENLTSPQVDSVHMSATYSISKDSYEFVHREILAFIEKISKDISQGKAEELACLNLDWFKF
jgi:uncharacterized protein (TIGR02147 family)